MAAVMERLRGSYATTVIVENKPGGAARVAIDAIKNAKPDGSEILFTPDFPITIYPHSFRSLSYDPQRDLAPVTLGAITPMILVTHPASARARRMATAPMSIPDTPGNRPNGCRPTPTMATSALTG